jgi:hypothetical protein
MEIDSWQLTEFNLDGRQIKLSDKFGLVKIIRSEDGLLVLIDDGTYGLIDQDKPTPSSFLRTDSLLGFVLDIGIQRTKRLTYGHGFYFGTKLVEVQSNKKVSQVHFDKDVYDDIGTKIETYFQSGDKHKEQEAIKIQFLLDQYNSARLLYPNFISDSYSSLMRLLDALGNAEGRYDFALFAASISSSINQDIYTKLQGVGGFADRIQKALGLFQVHLNHAQSKNLPSAPSMTALDDAGRVVYACFFSSYMYRNKFVHQGIPFPDTVKEAIMETPDAPEGGMAYLNPALGISWSRMHRPEGLEDGDLIDIHEVVGAEAQDFKDVYFPLVPSWHFVKRLAREAILKKANQLV